MAAKDYNHQAIEAKWQEAWADQELYKTADQVDGKNNFYTLFEFPYPSGNLHVGHWYAFGPTDVIARYHRMNGKNVLFPVGFDSFGLPAENAAIKRGLDPRKWTYKNIEAMTDQIKSMGASVDWSREVKTSDPEYYKWTQYIFTKFLERGLAYESEQEVNYCPGCKTVVANEQVVNGTCERCDSQIEKRTQKQWTLRITDYAEELLDDLDKLDWPEEVKAAQRAWIGKSEGAKFTFQVNLSNDEQQTTNDSIEVFTTRPDTLYGVTYLVLAPEHQVITKNQSQINNYQEVKDYIKTAQSKTDVQRQEAKEKTGVKLEGITAMHPATGEELPIYVADYVLGSYGTGAIMAVPAHDERDNEFAKKFDLPIKQVVAPVFTDRALEISDVVKTARPMISSMGVIQRKDGKIMLQTLNIEGRKVTRLPGGTNDPGETPYQALLRELEEETGYKFNSVNRVGFQNVKLHGRFKPGTNDSIHNRTKMVWLLNFEDGELTNALSGDEYEQDAEYSWHSVDEALKIIDKEMFSDEIWLVDYLFNPRSSGEEGLLIQSEIYSGLTSEEAGQKIADEFGEPSITYRLRDWSVGRQRYWGCPIPVVYSPEGEAVPVPIDHLPWKLPDDVDHTPDGTAPLARSKELVKRTEEIFGEGWTPATDTMDTFVDSSWYYVRYCDPTNNESLAAKSSQDAWLPVDFYSGGAEHTTMHLLYARFFYKAMRDCGLVTQDEPFKNRMNRSLILGPDGNKMSKSKGNVIDPDEQVDNVGADAVRTYLCFMGPYNEVSYYPWDPNSLVGVRKFLERVNGLSEYLGDESSPEIELALHKAIKGVTESIEQKKLNTGVSSLMILSNEIEKQGQVTRAQMRIFSQLIAPYAPHLAEEWWVRYDGTGSVHVQPWPQFDQELLRSEKVTIPVQINGKRIGQITAPRDAAQDLVEKLARGDAKLKLKITGDPKKVIYVKNRILNLVIDKNQ